VFARQLQVSQALPIGEKSDAPNAEDLATSWLDPYGIIAGRPDA
jgi:hypothetical protein